MSPPRTDAVGPEVWVIGEAADDPALMSRVAASGLSPRAVPGSCGVALTDLRRADGRALLAAARHEASTRDLLILALVNDTPDDCRAALDAGADGFVCWERMDRELQFRVELLGSRQREREASVRHERDLAALLDLTSDYARTRDVTELLHKVTVRLADELGILRAAMVLFEDDGLHGRIAAASDEDGIQRVVELSRYPELREVMKSGQALVLPDAPNHPLLDPVKDHLVGQAIGTIAAVPVAVQGKVLGALLLRTGPLRPTFSPRELAFVGTVAHATAVALRTARLLESAEAEVASLARYQGFFNAFFHGIAVLGERGELLSLNPSGRQLLGVAGPGAGPGAGRVGQGEIDGIIAGLRPASREALQELIHRTRAGDRRPEVDLPVALPNGRNATLAISAAPLGPDAGPGLERALLLCFRDVTAARATQAELRTATSFMERLIDQASDAIIAADMKGKVIVFNRGAERICGYRADDAIGHLNVRDLYPPGVAAALMKKIRSGDHGGQARLEPTRTEILSLTGEPVPVSMTAALLTEDLNGAVREVGTVGIFSDLRERMRLEATLTQTQEKLAQSERAALIAELAGAAAHELNQPLTSVMGYAELLKRRLRDDDPGLRSVDIIYREADRMADIVRKIGKITRYETKAYVGEARIVDLDKSGGDEGSPDAPAEAAITASAGEEKR